MTQSAVVPNFFTNIFGPSSLWGVYSETFTHHYNIPLAHSFAHLCMFFFSPSFGCTPYTNLAHLKKKKKDKEEKRRLTADSVINTPGPVSVLAFKLCYSAHGKTPLCPVTLWARVCVCVCVVVL